MERWRSVVHPLFSDRYEVSDLGRVRGLYWSRGKLKHPRMLKPAYDVDGYEVRSMSSGVYRATVKVHVLVLEAFVGLRPEGHVARHLNGVASDNRLVNLAWGTPTENYADRDNHGATARGSRVGTSKLDEAAVREIRSLYPTLTQQAIADRFGISQVSVSHIIRRKTWRHIP